MELLNNFSAKITSSADDSDYERLKLLEISWQYSFAMKLTCDKNYLIMTNICFTQVNPSQWFPSHHILSKITGLASR